MKLKCFAYFRDILGQNELDWMRPADTIGELLADLSARYGKSFRRWVYQDNGNSELLSDIAIILINGLDIRDMQGLDTPLKPDDTVCLFPPVAGG